MATDLKLHLKIHSYIAPLCQPTASSTTDISQGLFINSLNFYTLIFLQFSNILTFALQRTFTLSLFALFSGLIVFMMASLLLTCRTHPYIYKFTNAIILTLAGPATQFIPGSNLFFAMTFSFLSPSVILILFQQKLLAYLSFIAGYVFLNLFYLPAYQKTIINALMNDPDYTTYLHFNSYNFIYIFNALLLYTSFSMNRNSGHSHSSSQPVAATQTQFTAKFASHVETFMNQVLNNLNIALLEENYNKSKTYLTKAKVYGDALLSKARNLLDAERNLEANPVPTKVTDLLEKIWSNSSEMIKRKGLFGTITLHKMVPAVLMLDHHKFMQIVLSVIANAVRFTEKGDIDLSLSWIDKDTITDASFEPIPYDEGEGLGEGGGIGQAKTRTLGRGCRSKDEGESLHVFDTNEKKISDVNPVNLQNIVPKKGILKIIITDTGSGISQKDAQGLVNLFVKGVPSQKTKQVRKSNMWMVDQLCQKMGGEVRFYSKPGEGVTCIICIKTEVPSKEMLEQNPILEEVNIAPSQRKIKGILLDDNVYTSDTVKSYLEKCAVDVLHVARNKEELIEAYEKEVRQGKTIQTVIVNTQASLPEIKNINERLRNFEIGRRLEPCAVLFISEKHTESQLRASIDPNQLSKENNMYLRSPIHFPELQKALASINSNNMQEIREHFHPKKIFIVNDNTFNLDLLSRMLSMHGFDNIQALNGELAVEKYKTEWRDIACIFMDCQMPVMDGYEATRQIRKFQQANKIPKIKILGVSGHVGVAHDEECREAGMDATVAMPFTADKIKKVASECVAEFQ